MTEHQDRAVSAFVKLYSQKEAFVAALLVGSIAHGYSTASSDVDAILVATEPEFERRKQQGTLTFSLWDLCDYEGGYVDCKVVSWSSLETVADRGSDPARYAFQDARILYGKRKPLTEQLARITRYPVGDKDSRRHRFLCQLLAWKWYLSQGEAKGNQYLVTLALQKIVLFSCRVILNENERLYPYHKWLLAETERAPNKPGGLMAQLASLLEAPTFSRAQVLSDLIFSHVGSTEKDTDWPNQFLRDSEQNWLEHEAPIEDL